MKLREGLQGLGSEAGRRHAHLNRGFTHTIKRVAACFRRRAFIDQVTQDGGGGENGKVDVVERLQNGQLRETLLMFPVRRGDGPDVPTSCVRGHCATLHIGTIYLQQVRTQHETDFE